MTHANILIVEDELVGAMALCAQLMRFGYNVAKHVSSGEQAIIATDMHSPDLILMDVALAGEMDGVETAKAIHAHCDAPVVFLTGYFDSALVHRAKQADPYAYLVKPSSEHELYATIEVVLNAHMIRKIERELKDRYENILGAMIDGVVCTNKSGVIVYANTAAEKMFGYLSSELAGESITLLLPHLEMGAEQPVDNGLQEAVGRTHDMFEYPIEMRVSSIPVKDNELCVYVLHDISGRKHAEERVRVSEERFARIFNSSPVPIAIFRKRDRRILEANRHFFEILGCQCQEELNSAWIDEHLTINPGQKANWADILAKQNCVSGTQAVLRNHAGLLKDVLVSAEMIDLQGEECVLVMFDDITDIKQAEAKIRRINRELGVAMDEAVKAAQAKAMFLANMSHEIRTPLSGVLGMMDLLGETGLSDEQREFVDTASGSARFLLELLNDILDMSKIESGNLELESIEFNPRQVVEDATGLFAVMAHKKGLDILCVVASDVPEKMLGDPARLRQVLSNLIGNAVKFTAEGEVSVSCSVERGDGRMATLRFDVEDTGIGIEHEAQQLIFGEFTQGDASTTRKYGGTGLGLAISRRLVKKMRGDISVNSMPGIGSRFWFAVPLEQAEYELPTDEVPSWSGEAVLVVDGNIAHCGIMRQYLEAGQLAVEAASDAYEVFSKLDRGSDGTKQYAALLIDSGFTRFGEVIGSAKKNPAFSSARIIALHRIGTEKIGDDICGVDAWLSKPIKRDDLLKAVCAVHPDTEKNSVPAYEDASGILYNGKVLVAEDDAVNAKIILAMLARYGIVPDLAGNGIEAVSAASSAHYDLIFMDGYMPEMDGFEASRKIRNIEGEAGSGRAAIVALTALAMEGDRARFMESGIDGYLTKPVDRASLEAVLDRWLVRNKFDSTKLDELRSSLGDELEELVEMYRHNSRAIIGEMGLACEAGDIQKIHMLAHRLKSTSANFGITKLCGLARQLEERTSGIQDDPEKMRQLCHAIEAEYLEVDRDLEKYSRNATLH